MCTIVFAHKAHSKYPLIVLGNRDEFKNRPSKGAHYWPENPHIFAGLDLKEKGTWMGVTTDGRLAFITNYRDFKLHKPDMKSRGELTRDYLLSNLSPENYLKWVQQNRHLYNPFNLVVGTVDALWYYSNIQNKIIKISEGIHGLSNAFLNTSWYKVDKAKKALKDILKQDNIEVSQLFELLNDREIPDDSLLPNTGIDIELERVLSSINIDTELYGTLFKTIILVDKKGELTFYEAEKSDGIQLKTRFMRR